MGRGLLVLIETVFPPLPSEVLVPLAGFLSSQGELGVPLVLTSTLGAYLGALGLSGLGAALGQERSIRLLSELALVDRDDFERTDRWFARHGGDRQRCRERRADRIGRRAGTQYELVSRYSRFLNYAVYAVLAGLVVWLIMRRVRRRSRSA